MENVFDNDVDFDDVEDDDDFENDHDLCWELLVKIGDGDSDVEGFYREYDHVFGFEFILVIMNIGPFEVRKVRGAFESQDSSVSTNSIKAVFNWMIEKFEPLDVNQHRRLVHASRLTEAEFTEFIATEAHMNDD